jgi:hypothetical protein
MKLRSVGILIFLFTLVPALLFSQDDWKFEEWDKDENLVITKEEFKDGYIMSEYFSLWDANDDNFIAEDELKHAWKTYYMDLDNDGVFEEWDINVDGTLSRDEFIEGAFTIYDNDGDGDIEYAEYEKYQDDEKK